MNFGVPYALAFLLLCPQIAAADEPSSNPIQRYTFSWPLTESAPAPRGGTTRGAAVTLDPLPSPAWLSLQARGVSPFERDRRAILALTGDFRVTFDFLEVAAFNGAARDRPYQSWGTERVYVDQDQGTMLSLVHILEMHIVQKDGAISEPLVTKHWREDWRYEPKQITDFKGRGIWRAHALQRGERAGAWSQTVAQVDESPRYSSIGRWEHNAAFSTWISATTWRPLPRRELSVHKDYQVLAGTNRVSVTATGALQEENNLKMVLKQDLPDPAKPFLAREYGVARYDRMRDADFAAADQYYERTRQFWDEVHGAWSALYQRNARIEIDESSDKNLAAKLSDYAEELAAGRSPELPQAQIIQETLQGMLLPAAAKRPSR
jgi:hypothetical protein